jgi:hypothetical protein
VESKCYDPAYSVYAWILLQMQRMRNHIMSSNSVSAEIGLECSIYMSHNHGECQAEAEFLLVRRGRPLADKATYAKLCGE